jgi:hypothetical protein
MRRDQYNYYPSDNPFADLQYGLQSQTVGQDRRLTNGGLRSTLSYIKGIHNVKAGAIYQQTFLDEHDTLGIVDPTFNDPSGPTFNPVLAPYDLTRGGRLFTFNGHTDVKLLSLYLQDAITRGNWTINLGLRGDVYNGLSTHKEAEPASASPTTSSARTPSSALPMPASSKLPSTRTWSSPAPDAAAPCSTRYSAAMEPAPLLSLPDGATNSTLACNKPSDTTWFSRASTSGSTPTTDTISASWAPPRLPFRSSGTTPRFRDTPLASVSPIFTDSLRSSFSQASRPASSNHKSAGPARRDPFCSRRGLPHRPRPEVQPDHPHAISTMAGRALLFPNKGT